MKKKTQAQKDFAQYIGEDYSHLIDAGRPEDAASNYKKFVTAGVTIQVYEDVEGFLTVILEGRGTAKVAGRGEHIVQVAKDIQLFTISFDESILGRVSESVLSAREFFSATQWINIELYLRVELRNHQKRVSQRNIRAQEVA